LETKAIHSKLCITFVSAPKNIDPDSEHSPNPDVRIVPADYFFTELFEVPTALESGELDDFAELSMEGLAPFPLDQLYWGYLVDPEQANILIYAALRDRLHRAGYAELEAYIWVLPDFATLQGARFTEPTKVFLESEDGITLLDCPAGECLPSAIQSVSETSQDVANAPLRLKLITPEIEKSDQTSFEFKTIAGSRDEGHWTPLKPDEKTLWRADIRPKDYKVAERNVRRTTTWVTKLLGYATRFTVLLVLLEGLFLIGEFWQSSRQATIEEQSEEVRRIEDKQSLMNKLEQVAKNELRPIGILEAANKIRIQLGNTGIEYDEVVIDGINRITIEGKANTINELNAYTDSLGRSGAFQLIGDPKSITRSGKTTFTVTLDYTHQEPSPPEPAPSDLAIESKSNG
jgi:hypothetical protein